MQSSQSAEVVLNVETENPLLLKPIKVEGGAPPPKDLYKEKNPADRDTLLNEMDAPVRFPHWLLYSLYFVFGTSALVMPALAIALSHQRAEYWGLDPTNPAKGGMFSASLLGAIFCGFYMGTMAAIAFVPFAVRNLEKATNSRLLGARARSFVKHSLMIRGSFARLSAIIPTWTLSQWFVVLPAWAPQFFTILLIFMSLLFLKDMVIQRVSINYHTTYHEKRIATNKMALDCMKRLKRHYLPNFRHHRFSLGSRSPSDATDKDGACDFDQVDEYHPDAKSVAPSRVEELSGQLFNQIAAAAKKDELQPEDLEAVLGPYDAGVFFRYLDTDGNGDLTRKEFVQGIANVYTDRENLVRTLAESDDVINRLNWIATNAVLACGLVVCMSIFNTSWWNQVAMQSYAIILLKLFFGDLVTEAFVSIVFVFVSHPFDTGDAILLGGKPHRVRKIGLWYTSFYGSGRRLVYRRNSEICNLLIVNISRSGPMSEDLETAISVHTTTKQILALEERMSKFLKGNAREFEGATFVKNIKVANSEAMTITLEYHHKSNHSDNAVKYRRSMLFHSFFKDSLQVLDIKSAPYSYDLPMATPQVA